MPENSGSISAANSTDRVGQVAQAYLLGDVTALGTVVFGSGIHGEMKHGLLLQFRSETSRVALDEYLQKAGLFLLDT